MATPVLPTLLRQLAQKLGVWQHPKNASVSPYAGTITANASGVTTDIRALTGMYGAGGQVHNDGSVDVTITIDPGHGSELTNFNAVVKAGESYSLGESRPILIQKITLTEASGTASCRVLVL